MSRAWEQVGHIVFWLAWPALYIYLRIGARTRVYVIANRQILLVKGWLSDGSWHLPGGGLHRGEDPRVGAVREVREEVGLQFQPEQLIPLKREWRSSHGLKSYLHFFAISLEAPDTLRRQKGEIVAAQWFREDELPDPDLRAEAREAQRLL